MAFRLAILAVLLSLGVVAARPAPPTPSPASAFCRRGGGMGPINCPPEEFCQLQGPVPSNPNVLRFGICIQVDGSMRSKLRATLARQGLEKRKRTPAPTPSTAALPPSETTLPPQTTAEPLPSTDPPTPATDPPTPATDPPTPATAEPLPSTAEPLPSTAEPLPSTAPPPPSPASPPPSTGATVAGDTWRISIANSRALDLNHLGLPALRFLPDAHMPIVGNAIYFSWATNWRTSGNGPLPEQQTALSPLSAVFGGTNPGNLTSYDSGGKWFMAAYPPQAGFNSLWVAFYHAESHWDSQGIAYGVAWDSMGVATSPDGISWVDGGQVLTSSSGKPNTPTWGGVGNGGFVYDHSLNRWHAFWPDTGAGMMSAISYDPLGQPGTWLKWNNGGFTQPGLGGLCTPLIGTTYGANPAITWSAQFSTWVMLYGGWDGPMYMLTSKDLLNWGAPAEIVAPLLPQGIAEYPTLVGVDDKTFQGTTAKLYWADVDYSGQRQRLFMSADLTFLLL